MGFQANNKTRDDIRVAIVDDSRSMQMRMTSIFSDASEFIISGVASDAFEAKRLIETASIDVLTLDVEMPKMNGLTFLQKLMAWRPMPVVMVSGSSGRGIDLTLTALELGAVDFVAKPRNLAEQRLFPDIVKETVRLAAHAQIGKHGLVKRTRTPQMPQSRPQEFVPQENHGNTPDATPAATRSRCRLIAVGASTGGVQSIEAVLGHFPQDAPPMVISQHMPAAFTKRFAERLLKITGLDVAEASDGEVLSPGKIRLAPGNRHLRVIRKGSQAVCQLREHVPHADICPSVDFLFHSVAENFGDKAAGVILSGMGRDGAQGLLAMRKAGAETFGESQSSCTVYGMPKAAYLANAVSEELEISSLARRVSSFFMTGKHRHK